MPENQDHRALYLRWRPQSFSEVVGQEHVTRTLRNAVRGGKLAHAYLLCGPRGTGKTSLARILYRAANCSQPQDGEPCARCPSCTSAAAGRALDLVEVDAASNRGIDDIRQLRERVAYAPSEGRFRVYIIDEAHELTAPAWDAFLKTLEEPPPHTVFVLATTEAHKVPPTIVSRCQRFDLRRIGLAAIRVHLFQVAEQEGMQVEPAVLDCLARMARGGLRDALSLLDQLHAYAGECLDLAAARAMLGVASAEVVRTFVESISRADAAAALATLTSIIDEGVDLRQFVGEAIAHLRGLLLVRAGADSALSADFSTDDLDWLRQSAPRWSAHRLLTLVHSLADGTARLRDPSQLALHLELAVLEACSDEQTRGASASLAPAAPRTDLAALPTAKRVATPPPPADTRAEPTAVPVPPIGLSEPPPAAAAPEHALTADSFGDAMCSEGGTSELRSPVASPRPELVEGQSPLESESHSPRTTAHPELDEGSPLDLPRLRQRWPDVMERLRERNGMVAAMLEAAELTTLQGGELRLAFGFPFHQKQVSELKNRRLVEDVVAEVVGQPIRVSCWHRPQKAAPLAEQEFVAELDRLIAEDPVVRRAVDLWGRNFAIIE